MVKTEEHKEEAYRELLGNTHMLRKTIGNNLDDLNDIKFVTKKLSDDAISFIESRISINDLLSVITQWLKSFEKCKEIVHIAEDYEKTKRSYKDFQKLLRGPWIYEDWGISESYENSLGLMKKEAKFIDECNELSRCLLIIITKINKKEDITRNLRRLTSVHFFFGTSIINSILNSCEALISEYNNMIHDLDEFGIFLYSLYKK